MRPDRRLPLTFLLLAGALAPARAGAEREQGAGRGDPARVQALFAEARYGEALREAATLEDPVLAAEWGCYLHLAGGDHPGALRAAEAGLELQPSNRGLLVNAVSSALALGLEDLALDHALALQAAVERAGEQASPEEHARSERLLDEARRLDALHAAGRDGVARARLVASLGLALLVAALAALALRGVDAGRVA